MDCNLPSYSVHGIFQATILEWVAIPFSKDLPNPRIEPGLGINDRSQEQPGEKIRRAGYEGRGLELLKQEGRG